MTSVAAASCREAPSAATYLSRTNGLGTYAYMGTDVAPWVGVESGLTSIQTGSASPFARITGARGPGERIGALRVSREVR